MITENIEIAPVWKDCGEGNHNDGNSDNRCDDCGYILVKETEPSDESDVPETEIVTAEKQSCEFPIWLTVILAVIFAAAAVTVAVTVAVKKKNKRKNGQ